MSISSLAARMMVVTGVVALVAGWVSARQIAESESGGLFILAFPIALIASIAFVLSTLLLICAGFGEFFCRKR